MANPRTLARFLALCLATLLAGCAQERAFVRSTVETVGWRPPETLYLILREDEQTGFFLKYLQDPFVEALEARGVNVETRIVAPFDRDEDEIRLEVARLSPDAVMTVRQTGRPLPAIDRTARYSAMTFAVEIVDFQAADRVFWSGKIQVDCRAGVSTEGCARAATETLVGRLGRDGVIPLQELPKPKKPKKKKKKEPQEGY